ncbi:MAG: hypothetical protein M8357_10960 [Desulfobulbaceae bacterium]|nr:hypothetical protein [Desulfobulbaceae bacterium]
MKTIVTIFFLLLPVAASAQNQGMNGVDMGQMMMLMQEMQECMAKVDQAELEALEQRSEEMEAEITALCDQGKRDAAQKKAIAYGKEMMKNPAMIQMKECGEITRGLVPEESMPSMEDDFDFSDGHVCDE